MNKRKEGLSCNKCSLKASCPSILRYHSRTHSSEKPFKCTNPSCDYKTRWAQALTRHEQWCQGQDQIACGETSDGIHIVAVDDKWRRAGTTECFFQQGNIIEGEATYSCDFCSFSSKLTQATRRHLKVHSELNPAFLCPIKDCEYLAKWPQTVRKHSTLAHQFEFPPKTPLLQNPSTSLVRHHSRTHLSEKPFKCPNHGCDYMTCSYLPQSFQSHQRKCRGQIPCAETSDGISIVAVADKSRSAEMTEFCIETVSAAAAEENSRYSCDFCSFSSTKKQDMTTHLEVHSELNPAFRCPVQGCKYLAKWPQTVRKHARLLHQIEFKPKEPDQSNDNLGPVTDCGAETEVDVNNSDMVFACMLCDFIGDSELAALEHARQHTAGHIPLEQNPEDCFQSL